MDREFKELHLKLKIDKKFLVSMREDIPDSGSMNDAELVMYAFEVWMSAYAKNIQQRKGIIIPSYLKPT